MDQQMFEKVRYYTELWAVAHIQNNGLPVDRKRVINHVASQLGESQGAVAEAVGYCIDALEAKYRHVDAVKPSPHYQPEKIP